MNVTNIVRAVVKPGSDYTVTSPIMKENKGQILLIEGLDLPEVYEIDFSNDRHHGTSVTMIGNADGVLIPTQFIKTGRDVYAFYYYVGDNFGQTEHIFRLPNDYRPDRTEEVPEPEQESLIEQAISSLNSAVAQTALDVQTTTQKASEATESARSASISEQNAANSAETAVNAKNAAEGYAEDAMSAKNQAVASATSANESANTASIKASEASTNAITASVKADEARASAASASNDAGIASAAARSASSDASRAESARNTAQISANNAQASATSASQSATASANSASASAQSASDAETARQAATSLVAEAQRYANASEQSAQASANSATQAQGYANDASASAQSASGYATQADISANTASNKASEASTSAQTASNKASEASQSASQALTYKTDAETAKTASQTAQGLAESARDSAQGYASDAQGYANDAQASAESISASASQIAQNTADIASLEEDRYKPYVTDSASGSIASFVDGADGIPLKSLVVDIDPVQDLHGQDAPYPAGSGKNLFGGEFNQAFTFPTPIPANTTIAISCAYNSETSNARINLYRQNGSRFTNYGINTVSGDKQYRVITIGEDAYSVMFDVSERAWYQIEIGSTATEYAPYENICPISGWTGMQLTQANENLIPESLPDNVIKGTPSGGKIVGATNARLFAIPIPKSTTLHVQKKSNDTSGEVICLLDDGTLQVGEPYYSLKGFTNAYDQTYSAQERTWMGIRGETLAITEELFTTRELMVSVGNTRKDYVAPKGYSTRYISWQSEAGTVYGGKLDVLSGVMRVEWASFKVSDVAWTRYSTEGNYKFYHRPSNIKTGANIQTNGSISSAYPVVPFNDLMTTPNAFSDSANSTGRISVHDSEYTSSTVEEFVAGRADVRFVYPLATPIEIQLTPQQVNSLLGANNIWADTGDVAVEYRADTKLYIEKLTQPTEDDMVANSAITSGQFFMVGNTLYRAFVNIASGATITVGTNAQRVSLADALNLVNT